MNWPNQNEVVNAVIIVAHPDDETIFFGGTILSYPEWNWNIVCVTMKNAVRSQELDNAMQMYKDLGVNIISHQTLNKVDGESDLTSEDLLDWKNSISQLDLQPDIVFTHHRTSDYHPKHHIPIARIAFELFNNVWETVYPGNPEPNGITEYTRRSKCFEVELTQGLLKQKKEIFDTSYKSQVEAGIYTNNIPGIIEYEFEKGPEIFTSG